MAQALHTSDIQLFTILKGRLGETEAEQLVALIKTETEKQATEKYEQFGKDLENAEKGIRGYIGVKLTESNSDITLKIAEAKAELIKKMFVFALASALVAIVAIIAIVKLMR